jgi:hypothetical protein
VPKVKLKYGSVESEIQVEKKNADRIQEISHSMVT